jgi:hypothetical protein
MFISFFGPKFAGTWPKICTDTVLEPTWSLVELGHTKLAWLLPGSPQKPSGFLSGTSLNLVRLCTKAFRNLLRNLLRNPVEPDVTLHPSLSNLFRNLFRKLNLTRCLHQNLPEPSPEPSPETRWTWPGACTSAHRS